MSPLHYWRSNQESGLICQRGLSCIQHISRFHPRGRTSRKPTVGSLPALAITRSPKFMFWTLSPTAATSPMKSEPVTLPGFVRPLATHPTICWILCARMDLSDNVVGVVEFRSWEICIFDRLVRLHHNSLDRRRKRRHFLSGEKTSRRREIELLN